MKNPSAKPKLKPDSGESLQKLLEQNKTKTRAFEKMLRFLEGITDDNTVKMDKGDKETTQNK